MIARATTIYKRYKLIQCPRCEGRKKEYRVELDEKTGKDVQNKIDCPRCKGNGEIFKEVKAKPKR